MFRSCFGTYVPLFREFVLRDSPDEIKVILVKKKPPSILGSEGFMERMRKRFSPDKGHVKVPQSRSLAPGGKKDKGSGVELL